MEDKKTKIVPYEERIIFKKVEEKENKTSSGIIISTDSNKVNTIKGIIVSENMEGQTIFCMEHSDIGKIISNDEILYIINKKDIIAEEIEV